MDGKGCRMRGLELVGWKGGEETSGGIKDRWIRNWQNPSPPSPLSVFSVTLLFALQPQLFFSP